MIAIDTNLIVRYLTGDHPEQSYRAREIINAQSSFVAITIFLEVEWVLCSVYGYSRSDVVRALRAFAGLPTIELEDASLVAAALNLVDSGLDFADALHLVKSTDCEAFLTFDKKLVKAAHDVGYQIVQEA